MHYSSVMVVWVALHTSMQQPALICTYPGVSRDIPRKRERERENSLDMYVLLCLVVLAFT